MTFKVNELSVAKNEVFLLSSFSEVKMLEGDVKKW